MVLENLIDLSQGITSEPSSIQLPGFPAGQTFDTSLAIMGVENRIDPGVSAELANALENESHLDPNAPTIGGIDIGNDTGGLVGSTDLGKTLNLNPQDAALNAIAPVTGSSSSLWTDIFLRSIVVITGFIFVAVGLSMFKSGDAQTIIKYANPIGGLKK